MSLDELKLLYAEVFGKVARGSQANQVEWLRKKIIEQQGGSDDTPLVAV